MEIFLAILVLLSLIGISHVIQRFIPFVPIPLIQIMLGIILIMLPFDIHVPIDPELFLVLFIAPLLFNDGKKTPREELWRLRAPILLLAVGLVFLTILIGGYALHALIPTMPLAAAFGLAAILSPTDAVAVSAMSARIHMPKQIQRLLEGEALMNDASGLVAFKFAIAATVTGLFSIWEASFSFIIIALGGLLFGALLSMIFIWGRLLLRRFGMEDVTVHMLILILTPFLLYILAEEFGLSGILAAVAGGIVHAIEQDKSESPIMELKVVSDSTWSVILFVLNGLVFILLGLQVPDVLNSIFSDSAYNNYAAVGYVVLLYLLLMGIRFLWLFLGSKITKPVAWNSKIKAEKPSLLNIMIISVSGVRGALTLAGAFSIPLFLHSGAPFPERSLMIFLAAGVILLSLIVASIALPILTAKNGPRSASLEDDLEKAAQIKAIQAAIQAIKNTKNSENNIAASLVINSNEQRLVEINTSRSRVEYNANNRREQMKLHRFAVEKERDYLEQLLDKGEASHQDVQRLQIVLTKIEMVLTNKLHFITLLFSLLWEKVLMILSPQKHALSHTASDLTTMRILRIRTSEEAVRQVSQSKHKGNEVAVLNVIAYYNQIMIGLRKQLSAYNCTDTFNEQKSEMEIISIQAERNALQTMFEQTIISRKVLNKLQQQVSIREADIIEAGL
ncbi:Na+/H+ antiporter [Paenibacillus psychroresistens]|uniref:Na+/H+ antiporter n=1 Tax=Paenibacillus psychroresistens TaxID=1778678 RepID=A0A6B8RNY4_9BACL|nr:Na+/H+ antiporter [Paenibacillus psychroresistens]QGQ97265.1 Na+/H+ antiporter [Paenibacillus psychroresistens]